MPPSALISVYDASQILGCSCQTVRALIARGVLQGTPLPGGRKLWLNREQVEGAKENILRTLREQKKQDRARRETLLQLWLEL